MKKRAKLTKNKFKAVSEFSLPTKKKIQAKYSNKGGTNTFKKRFCAFMAVDLEVKFIFI